MSIPDPAETYASALADARRALLRASVAASDHAAFLLSDKHASAETRAEAARLIDAAAAGVRWASGTVSIGGTDPPPGAAPSPDR